jgi:hypothetical protein
VKCAGVYKILVRQAKMVQKSGSSSNAMKIAQKTESEEDEDDENEDDDIKVDLALNIFSTIQILSSDEHEYWGDLYATFYPMNKMTLGMLGG